VIERFAEDDRESVVTCLLSTRESKDGWIQVFSPGGSTCEDDGAVFTKMVAGLTKPGIQTGKMKKFLMMLATRQLQVVIMLALRENPVMIKVRINICGPPLVQRFSTGGQFAPLGEYFTYPGGKFNEMLYIFL